MNATTKQFETLNAATTSAAATISGMDGAIVAVIKTAAGKIARLITKRAKRKTTHHERTDMDGASGIGKSGAPYTFELVRPVDLNEGIDMSR